jgi:riboflavin kinase/FMN adenylyltransferase
MSARSIIARIDASVLATAARSRVVTIGNFDGVHLGHLHVVRQTVERARQLGLRSIALTFEPHPVTFFKGVGASELRLTTASEREFLLRRAGIDDVITLPFDADTAAITADDFVDLLLVGALGAAEVHVGWDFRFGHERVGDVAFLSDRLAHDGALACAYGAFELGGEPVSSTRVRKALRRGDIVEAAQLLGRFPVWSGVSAHGAGRGKGVGIPTVNLYCSDRLLPLFGVYATRITVVGQSFDSITNIGTRPTFENDGKPSIETMILSPVDGDLHGLPVQVEVRGFVRSELRFDSAEALREQIGRDVARAREILASG